MNRRALLLLLPLLLAACASHGPALPPRLMAAIDANNQAASALVRGELASAERLYLKALAHDRAIENVDGIALDLLGLAQTYQRAGRPDEALRAAALVSDAELPGLSQPRLAEAALLAATLALARADWPAATQQVAAAEAHCPPQACALEGRIANLKAQLAIVGNRLDEAQAQAQKAIALAEAAGDQAELANALRSAGNVSLFGAPAQGVAQVERALAIDKQLALSGKIHRDLVLLGRLQLALGARDAAVRLFARARSVAEADGNAAGVAEVVQLERELGGNHGK
jgi:tetratricopeptide (TPR) repeat protein